jgi:hypothetical protein
MADYPISNVARRIVYTGSAGVGPYAFPFEVLTSADINVYKNNALLTLTTNYTVTISPTLGTGFITLVLAATNADRITIVGARAIQRTTDFTTGGDFFANTLNDEMDSQTILVQQVAETADRSIKAPVTDPTSINMVLPINTARANKTLSFDINGNPIAGDAIGNFRGNWTAGVSFNLRDLVIDTTNSNVYIVLVAHTSSGVLPISTNADSAKWGLIVNASAAGASATAAASSASAASTSASSATSSASTATTQAGIATTQAGIATTQAGLAVASYDSFDDRYLGAKASNPTLDNDGNTLLVGALYFNSTSNTMLNWTGSAWVSVVATTAGAVVNTPAGNIAATNVQTALDELDTEKLASTLASGVALNTSISTVASSATPNIWTSTSNVINYTGTTTATGFATAPQAGVSRTLILAGATSFTAGANMLIDGVVSFTGAAGDEVEVFAVTTTQFRLRLKLASGTAGSNIAQTFSGGQRGAVTALTSTAASIAINLATNNNFSHTTTENTTLAAPSNPVAGQSGVIVITQGATARTLAYNTFYKFAGGTVPALTATASAVDSFAYYVESATRATCQLIKDVK